MDLDLEEEENDASPKSHRSTSDLNTPALATGQPGYNENDYFFKRNAKTKRGILPKNATNVMKKWLFQHIIVSF